MGQENYVGMVGFGSMGRMLASGWVRTGTRKSDELYVATRNPAKVMDWVEKEEELVNICGSNVDAASSAPVTFLCVPPAQVKPVLAEVRTALGMENRHLVSLASCVSLELLARVIPGAISRVVPSFVSEVNEGVFLVCHNDRVSSEQRKNLESLLTPLGKVREIPEGQIEVYTELTSCAPGIFSAVFDEFLRSALRHGGLGERPAREVFVQTLYGLTKLYQETGLGFQATLDRVARPGGMTEIGAQVVREKLPGAFDEIFGKTLDRYQAKKAAMADLFNGGKGD